jgi:serum/glucocorticoid-regulated kinase 2
MEKLRILKKNSIKSVMNENSILRSLNHPLIIGMDYAFQNKNNLYLIMPNKSGGDLRYHIIKNRFFDEKCLKFFSACLILSLEYIHKKNILHRDIKPENLVFDDNGYLFLTDFGIAKYWKPENYKDTSGTPGYMAPEVMARKNHSFCVDFYALGIIIYECIMGRRPYLGKTRKEIKEKILSKQAVIKREKIPDKFKYSKECIDLCNKLIQRKMDKRIGFDGAKEIKNHSWFRDFDWEGILEKRIKAPFLPNSKLNNFDEKHVLKNDMIFDSKEIEMLNEREVQKYFQGYEFKGNPNYQDIKIYSHNVEKLYSKFTNENPTTCSSTKN